VQQCDLVTGLIVETSLGEVAVALRPDAAPQSCRYVLQLVDRGALNCSSVFRIVTPGNDVLRDRAPIEVVQLGHRCSDPATPIVVTHETTAQTGLRHVRGTVSLPRWRPGATYESFFICLRDEPALDHSGSRNPDRQGFAAFGSVVGGWPVLEAIRSRAEEQEYLSQPIPVMRVWRSWRREGRGEA
jgi:peptidyl-prolyl cis-trans isomerase A (cyclophilin A)